MSRFDVDVYAWMLGLSQVTGRRGKARFYLGLLVDAIRAHEVLVRAEFETPSLQS